MHGLVAIAGFGTLAVAALAAPTQSTPPDTQERVVVRLVQMAILAKDRRGAPIDDLVANEIVVKDRGRKMRVAFLEPFAPRPTLALICSHEGRDGHPLPQSPDTIVRRAFERARQELGFEAWALGEVEFFLGRSSLETEISPPWSRTMPWATTRPRPLPCPAALVV